MFDALITVIPNRLLTIIERNRALVSNSSAMAVGALVSAGLGFVYWWLAARLFSSDAVGSASAVISLLGLCGLMGEFGLGTMLVGEIPRRPGSADGLTKAALISALAISAVCGLLAAVLFRGVLMSANSDASSWSLVLFVIGTAVNGFVLTLDQALIGYLSGGLQMARNVAFAILKLLLLWCCAWFVDGPTGVSLLASWVVGMILSVAVVGALSRRASGLRAHSDWTALRGVARGSVDHHVLNMVTQAPGLALPIVVATLISTRANAAFFAAWMILNVALLVPASLSTVLFTVGHKEPSALAERAEVSLRVSLVAATAAAVVFLLFSKFILAMFNPTYPAIAGDALKILGFTAFGTVIKYHFIALKRLEGKMLRGSLILGLGGIAELGCSAAGAVVSGLAGLTWGLLLAVTIEGIVMLPSVLKLRAPVARGQLAPAASA